MTHKKEVWSQFIQHYITDCQSFYKLGAILNLAQRKDDIQSPPPWEEEYHPSTYKGYQGSSSWSCRILIWKGQYY